MVGWMGPTPVDRRTTEKSVLLDGRTRPGLTRSISSSYVVIPMLNRRHFLFFIICLLFYFLCIPPPPPPHSGGGPGSAKDAGYPPWTAQRVAKALQRYDAKYADTTAFIALGAGGWAEADWWAAPRAVLSLSSRAISTY